MIDSRDFEEAARELERRGFARQAGRSTAWAAKKAANAIRRRVREKARPHRRTGRLSSAVRVSYSGQGLSFEATVRAGGMVAPMIVKGTKPHPIEPVKGRVLSLTGPRGSLVGFAASVQHPGTRPDPFFAEGVDAARGDVQAIANTSADTMARELAHRMNGRRRL